MTSARLAVRILAAGPPAALDAPSCDTVDSVRPPLELGFFELEIGPPADAVDVLSKRALLAANGSKMALVDGVPLEQRLDLGGEGGLRRGRTPAPEGSATPVEDA